MTNACATRRGVLGTALAFAAGKTPLAVAKGVPEAAILLVPGPEDGPAARFAQSAAAGLARGLVQASALRVSVLGGAEGITAANRFAATAAPDGELLLLLTGMAAQAQLIGEGRARYEPRHWPAVAGSLMPALVAGRGAPGDTEPLRLALTGPAAPEAAALLAMDLIGRPATPVFLPPGLAPDAAIAAGIADAVVLGGPAPDARAMSLGLSPWFVFDDENAARDPALPDVVPFGALLPDPGQAELVAGLRAAGAALRVRGLLVLPALTSADSVALWRGAAQRWAEDTPEPAELGARTLAGKEAADALATLCPPAAAQLAYRAWLQRRLNWQAS